MQQTCLGKRKHVRHEIGLVAEAKHLASAAKAGHHLVANHEDAVLITQRAHPCAVWVPDCAISACMHTLKIAARRLVDAVGARHRLHQDGCNGRRPFLLNVLAQCQQAAVRNLWA